MKSNIDHAERKMRGGMMESLGTETIRAVVKGKEEALMKVLEIGTVAGRQYTKRIGWRFKGGLTVALLKSIPEFEFPEDEVEEEKTSYHTEWLTLIKMLVII